MDIKAKINEIVEKLKNDDDLFEKFEKNPTSVLEEYIGVDLPDDQINDLVDAIKAKLAVDKLGGVLGGLFPTRQYHCCLLQQWYLPRAYRDRNPYPRRSK